MNTLRLRSPLPFQSGAHRSGHDSFSRRLLFSAFRRIQHGKLIIMDAQGESHFGDHSDDGLEACIVVHDNRVWHTVLTRGSIGAGEAWMDGLWSSPDLTAVIRLFVRNRVVLNSLDGTGSYLARLAMQTIHRLNRNTLQGSKRNISAHYDLSNDFFRLFLDPTMMYSSAVYSEAADTLDAAAVHKLDVICETLQLRPSDHLVEIGSGWGGMAIHAARHYGCRVTSITISEQQYLFAKARIEAEGLQDRVTLLLKDYRELTGPEYEGRFDKLVSIEMIEAVGADFQPGYFRICSNLLKPGGLALIQAITIAEAFYEQYLADTDFIRQYIFPGGCLPTLERMDQLSRQHSALHLQSARDITFDYARTLRDWRDRFIHQIDAVKQLGFDEPFIRMWEFYLCYCEGGFLERSTGTYQVLFAKTGRNPE